jgi:hypothetical protein
MQENTSLLLLLLLLLLLRKIQYIERKRNQVFLILCLNDGAS